MIKYIIILIILFVPFFLSYSSGISDKTDYRFNRIGIEQGLSQSTILSIEQDSRGYIWFGTASGLNRYDGYEFLVYINDDNDSSSISGNEISAIYRDTKDNLWIGTTNGMLNKFNPDTESFIRYDIARSSDWYSSEIEEFSNFPLSFSRNLSSTITSISEDAAGELWIGTWGKGIVKFNPITLSKKYYYYFLNRLNSLTSNKITDLLVDSRNDVWIGTFGGGLNKIEIVERDSVVIQDFNKVRNFDFGSKIITLYEDTDFNIWVGSYGGKITTIGNGTDKNGNSRRILPFTEKLRSSDGSEIINVMDIVEDRSSNIWIGTYGKGLFCYSPVNQTIKHFYHNRSDPTSISEDEIQSLFVDESGILWIGTQLGSGINKLEIGSYKFNSIPVLSQENKSLNDKIVWAISEDKDENIWIGTHRGGINIWKKEENNFEYLNKSNILNDNHIRSFIEDNRGNMWIGSYSGGLSVYNRKENSVSNISDIEITGNPLSGNQVQAMLIDEDSLLMIGTFGGGLNILNLNGFYDGDSINFKSFVHNPSDKNSISDNKIYTIFQDSDKNLWIGTHGGGLNLFNKDSGSFTNFNLLPAENTLSDDRIMVISETVDRNLLIGTFGGGLNLYNKSTGRFERLNNKIKVNFSDVYGILNDESGYWLSTDNGIFKINLELNSYTQYDLSDGLQSLEFSGGAYCKGGDGNYYFGGINGVNYFNPDNIEFDDFVPPVVITNIKVFDQPIRGERKNLVFDLDQNYFSFEFASLDFKNSIKNKYKFILEGLDTKWSYTDADNRKVFYTNLSPGEYTFRVMGTNADGIWSPHEASVDIKILAPFWMRWWFISGMILFVGGLITFFINQRIRYLVALDRLKTNIAADLHDNVGAGLTEISILSELAFNETKDKTSASRHLKQISDLSRQMVESMSDIVWVVNPTRDSLYDLVVRLKDVYSELLLDLGIKLKTSNLDNLINIKLPMDYRQNLYLILKEALHNCIKHSKCQNIDLDIRVIKNIIRVKLYDDGIGFNYSSRAMGNGLANIRKRGEKIGGNVDISSRVNAGTTIQFEGKIRK